MILSLLAVATLGCGLLIGFVPTLLDSLKKPWQARLNQSPQRLEWALRLFYFAWLPAMPLVGLLLDHWPSLFRETLFSGLLGLILGLAWLALVRSLPSLLASMFFLGLAYSALTTASVRLMTIAFFLPSDGSASPHNLASLNLGFIAVALGAWLGPLAAGALERWTGYRQGLLYLSLACIVPAALTALNERSLFQLPGIAGNAWETVFAHPQMGMIAGIILLYFAIENCLEFWPEPYLKELGYQSRGLLWAMGLFWLAFIAMRGAAAWWLYEHPGQGLGLTLVVVVISAMVMGNLAGGYEVGSGSLGFWLTGACYGPMLPAFLGLALDVAPTQLPTSVLGLLLSLSGLDTLIVRPLMQAFATGRSARNVMRVPIVLALLLAAPLLILALMRG